MNELTWYQRIHWRFFLFFIVSLVVTSVVVWFLVLSREVSEAWVPLEKGLAAGTVGALIAGVLATIGIRHFLRSRFEEIEADLEDASTGGASIRPRTIDELEHLSGLCVQKIGEMRRDVGRLELEKGRLSALLAGMSEAVVMVDDRERILLANPVARELLDLDTAYQGKRLAEVCDVERLVDFVANVLWSGESDTTDLDFPLGSDVRHISVSAAPIVGERQRGVVVVLYDVTRLRRLERVRRDFVANVSHELRTPIASIKSSAETLMLEELGLGATAKEFVETIFRNSERMATIVDDLLVLSRLEAAGEDISLQSVDLASVFAEVVDRSDSLARDRDLIFEVDLEEDLPPIKGEPNALVQVLQNLVENAIKYTPPGGKVALRAVLDGDRARIEVEDTGVGIPEEHLPRIFERFYRVDAGRSREIGGTGLGLAIVKHLVRKLGGNISVESRVGRTRFALRFPLAAPNNGKQKRDRGESIPEPE